MEDLNRWKRWANLIGGLVVAAGLALAVVVFRQSPPTASAQQTQADEGVVITGVIAGSPADKAGLKRGDILLAINDKPVNDLGEVAEYVLGSKAGDAVRLTVRHGDEQRALAATLADNQGRPFLGVKTEFAKAFSITAPITGAADLKLFDPTMDDLKLHALATDCATMALPDFGEPFSGTLAWTKPFPGEAFSGTLELGPGNPLAGKFDLRRFGMPGTEPFSQTWSFGGESGGMTFDAPFNQFLVIDVEAESPAAKAGLKSGDIITAIDGKDLESPFELLKRIADRKPGDTVTLTVHNDDKADRTVTVTLGERKGQPFLGVANPAGPFMTFAAPAMPGMSVGPGGKDRMPEFDKQFLAPMREEALPSDGI